MMRKLFFCLMFGLFMANTALAAKAFDCDNPVSDDEIAACLNTELRDSDKKINETYKALMNKLDAAAKDRLRKEQRSWLKYRDGACKLDNKESNREKWFQKILQDHKQTVCVVRFTRARTEQLDTMLSSLTVPDNDDAQNALGDNDRYEISSSVRHSKGKWYYEVLVNVGEIAKSAETTLWLGASSSYGNTGRLFNIRRKDVNQSIVRLGFGFDFDNGKYFQHTNGAWLKPPGSAEGFDMKTGHNYSAYITSSVAMNPMLANKSLQINFGDQPFAYPMPNGYRPFIEK
ncbi:MAG TPA: hypothetical protein DCQ37_05055 [Desulfobacteraceae bacterium]|nr:hypothetical protein [Desulfobacteraceae bacterium]